DSERAFGMTKTDEPASFDVRSARDMARRVIEHHFGTKPKRIVHQASGLSNFVFLVHHAEGEFIVRISPEPAKLNAFIKEQWAVAQARAAGVPTSEILEVGNEVIPYPFMVSQRVRGHEATRHPERLSILREMGRYAALINSIPTAGFGSVFDWSNNQLSRNETWDDFLHKELRLEARLELLRRHRMLSPQKLKELSSSLEGAAGRKLKPALNHGDLRLKNVMVDERGAITAIIDWEDCVSSIAPQWELSVALHDLSIDEKQEFLQGYGLPDKKATEIAPVVKALNLINYAPYVEQLAEAGNAAQIERYRTRLSGALDLYSL
ncbi:MAG: phosphotransferase family protein, partial [Pyrinomonadaceae bacterium]